MRWLDMLSMLSTDTYNGQTLPHAWGYERRWVNDTISDGGPLVPKTGWCFRGFPGTTRGKRGQDFGGWYRLFWDQLEDAGGYDLDPIRAILRAHKAYYDKYNAPGTPTDLQGQHYIPAHIAIYVHTDVTCRVPASVAHSHVNATYTSKPFGADDPEGPLMNDPVVQKAYAELIKEIGTTFCDPAGAGTDHDLGDFLAGIWPAIGVAGEANISGTVEGYAGLNISAYKVLEWMMVGFDTANRRPYDPTGYTSGDWYDYGDGAHPELGSWLSPITVCERWVRRPHQGVYIMGTGDAPCYQMTEYSHWCEHHDGQGIPPDGDGHDVRNYYTSQVTATDKSRHRRIYERLHSLAPQLPNGHYSDAYRQTDLKFGRFDISICKDAYWGMSDTRDITLGMVNDHFQNTAVLTDLDLLNRRQIVIRDWSYDTGTKELTWTHAHFLDWGVTEGSAVFFQGDGTAYLVGAGGVTNTVLTLPFGPVLAPAAGDVYLLMAGTAREIGSCIGNEHAWAANLRDSYGVFLRMAQMRLENIDTEPNLFEVLWALQWRNPNPSNPRWPTTLETDGWFLSHREFTLLGHSMWDFVNHYTEEWATNGDSHPPYGAWRIFQQDMYTRWRGGYNTTDVRATRGMVSGAKSPTTAQIGTGFYETEDTSRMPDDITYNASPVPSQFYDGTEEPTHEDMKILTTSTATITRVSRKVNDVGALIEPGGSGIDMTDTSVAPLLYKLNAPDPDVPGNTDKKTLYGWYGVSYLGQGTLEIQPFHNTLFMPNGTPVVVCLVLANVASDLEISYNPPVGATAQIYNHGYPNSPIPSSYIRVPRQDNYRWRRVWLYSSYYNEATIKIKSCDNWRGESWFRNSAARNYLHAIVFEQPWGWYDFYLKNKGAQQRLPGETQVTDGKDIVGQSIMQVDNDIDYDENNVVADKWGNRLLCSDSAITIISPEGRTIYSETLAFNALIGKPTVSKDGVFYVSLFPTVVGSAQIYTYTCERRTTEDPASIVVRKNILTVDYDDTNTHTLIDMSEYEDYLYILSADITGNAVHCWPIDGSATATPLISGAALNDACAIDALIDGIFILTSESISKLLKYSFAGALESTTSLDYADYSQKVFGAPNWVSVSPDGKVYVTDQSNNRVQVFDENGTYLFQFGSTGSGDGEFESPSGIAVSPNHVYVAEYSGNRRVQIFNHDGTFVSSFGGFGMGDGQFMNPTGIAYAKLYDYVAVADVGRGDVQVFTSDGTFLYSIAGPVFPMGMATWFWYLYVADATQQKVLRFDLYDGSALSSFGSSGTGDGEFHTPVGVACDGGYLYVGDAGNHRIQKFSVSGVYMDKYGRLGTGANRLNTPYGLSCAQCPPQIAPKLYICDSGNYRVMVRNTADLSYLNKYGTPGSWVSFPHIAADITHIAHTLYISFPYSYRIDRYLADTTFLGSIDVRVTSIPYAPPCPYSVCGVTDGTHPAHIIVGMSDNTIYAYRPGGSLRNPTYFGPQLYSGIVDPPPLESQNDKYAPDGGDKFMLMINGTEYSRYAVNWEVPEGDGKTW